MPKPKLTSHHKNIVHPKLTFPILSSDEPRRVAVSQADLTTVAATLAGNGPVTFDMPVSTAYVTNNPKVSYGTITVRIVYSVRLNWNFDRTVLIETDEKKPVEFLAERWLESGKGPRPVFKQSPGPRVTKIGQVSWEARTDYLPAVETDTANKRYRNVITPRIRLIRTYVPLDGGSPETAEDGYMVTTSSGGWLPLSPK